VKQLLLFAKIALAVKTTYAFVNPAIRVLNVKNLFLAINASMEHANLANANALIII
jgi:hypothetical protein